MGVFNNFPYTNWHELNLDWFIAEFERLQSEWDSFGYTVTATAHPGLTPNVTVTGDLTSGLNFDFTLVKGDQGDPGNTGATGNGIASVSIDGSYQLTFTFTDGTTYTTPSLKGPQGEGLEILDTYPTLADLQTAHPYGTPGDAYLIGVSPSFMLYIWSASSNAWVQAGALSSPSPSVTTPIMDGIADNGSEFAYARGDHVHPTDTSRASQTDMTALQNTVSAKADSTTVTALANRVSTTEGDITNLQTGKQDLLISGNNIKTVSGNSILGNGDLALGGMSVQIINDTESTTSTTMNERNYLVTDSGLLYIGVSLASDWATGNGNYLSRVSKNGNIINISTGRQSNSESCSLGAYAGAFISVQNGDTIKLETMCSKTGTKTVYWNLLALSCTVTQQ